MTLGTEEACAVTNTLSPAGIVSRTGKLMMGLLQIWLVFVLVTNPQIVRSETPPFSIGLLAAVGLAFLLLPWTVNLGFNKKWHSKPLIAALIALGLAANVGFAAGGSLWNVPTALVLYVITIYVHGHMGICHVIAALIATPGCEMRAIPQVWSKITRSNTEFHVCPGMWSKIDDWEHAWRT